MIRHDFHLSRDSFGRLVLAIGDRNCGAVVPVRSFPIAAPEEGISLVGTDGSEQLWIDTLSELPDDMRILVEEELTSREFTPEIRRIRHASRFATPSRWQVETDRGDTDLVLKAEEDIRRLSPTTLLISDSRGIQFLIRDVPSLDKASRRILDRFL